MGSAPLPMQDQGSGFLGLTVLAHVLLGSLARRTSANEGIEGMFKMFGNFLKSAKEGLDNIRSQVNNKEFMEAAMAGCALVAWADGEVSSAEKQKMSRFIEMSPMLQAFERSRLLDVFKKFDQQFEFDFGMGKDAAIKEIREVKEHEQRVLLVRLLVAIAGADGTVEPAEKKILSEIIRELGLTPAAYLGE